MGLRLRVIIKRIFPFILFRSLAQFAFWIAIVTAGAAVASLFEHGGRLQASIVGGMIGSLFTWVALLPYELRVDARDIRACLVQVSAYLVWSNMVMVDGGNPSQVGVGTWTANLPWWRKWKGNDVDVSVDGTTVVVQGPRSMIKPLWRNFRGPWNKVLKSA